MGIDLAYLATDMTDDEFARIVLSSGDFFPGFYRFTLGDRNYEQGQLSPNGLIAAALGGVEYTRDQWMRVTKQRMRSMDTRSMERSDYAIHEMLHDKYIEWMVSASEYDIALIEIDATIDSIQPETTYFFMGSLVRFEYDEFLIGYDTLRGDALICVPMKFTTAKSYIESLYRNRTKDLFLPADVVASLLFVDDIGAVNMNTETLNRLIMCHPNSIVIASNRDRSKHLPIRWAKDIILTEVTSASA